MQFSDALSLATRMFKNRPLRTMLTILGVSVGIGTVLFLVSFGYGLQKIILAQITTTDSLLSLDVSPGVSKLIELNDSTVSDISQMNGVTEVSKLSGVSGQITLNDIVSDGLINVVDESFFRLDGIVPEHGNGFTSPNAKDAVISSATAKLFNLPAQEMIGKKIFLTLFTPKVDENGLETVDIVKLSDPYVIRGVIEDENNIYTYIPAKTLGGVAISKYDRIKVKVNDSMLLPPIRDTIIEKGFIVSSLSDTIDQVNKIFKIIQIVLFSFGFIALVVSAIGMFNTMTIALLERTNEIGIMRSIGITSRDVKVMFLVEALVMGFLGGAGGVAIGYAGGKIINLGLNLLAKSFGGRALDLFYSPAWFVGVIIVFSTVVGIFTGVYPSLKASKLNPLDALRYK